MDVNNTKAFDFNRVCYHIFPIMQSKKNVRSYNTAKKYQQNSVMI